MHSVESLVAKLALSHNERKFVPVLLFNLILIHLKHYLIDICEGNRHLFEKGGVKLNNDFLLSYLQVSLSLMSKRNALGVQMR